LSLVQAGDLTVDIDRTLPLEQLPEAYRLSRAGEAQGKIVIRVQD
jgi:NADPH:quinone reductase-like Zn-dependent oxidoreductase